MSDALYDEAGDVPPTGGFPDRRHETRREDDAIKEKMEVWLARMLVSRFRAGAVLTGIVATLTWFFTSLGYRYTGPADDIRALDRKFTARDSIMNVRVTRIEDGQALIRDQLQSITESLRFIIYIQCTGMPRDSRPATCYASNKGGGL
jgi:hypothetical protein